MLRLAQILLRQAIDACTRAYVSIRQHTSAYVSIRHRGASAPFAPSCPDASASGYRRLQLLRLLQVSAPIFFSKDATEASEANGGDYRGEGESASAKATRVCSFSFTYETHAVCYRRATEGVEGLEEEAIGGGEKKREPRCERYTRMQLLFDIGDPCAYRG